MLWSCGCVKFFLPSLDIQRSERPSLSVFASDFLLDIILLSRLDRYLFEDFISLYRPEVKSYEID